MGRADLIILLIQEGSGLYVSIIYLLTLTTDTHLIESMLFTKIPPTLLRHQRNDSIRHPLSFICFDYSILGQISRQLLQLAILKR